MNQISNMAILFLLGLFAILALFVAAGGHDNFQYWTGLAFFVALVLLAFYAVHHMTSGHGKGSSHH